MSFGFSIGDFFAVGNLAWSLYKSCKGAGGAFEEVSHEVISLHTALRELQDEIENPDSIFNRTGASKKKELGILVQNCNGVLQQLSKLLIKYKSLGTASKKAWDRLRFGTENLQEIREKIMNHTSSLTLFLTTLGTGSLGRIEKKLDQLIEDVRAGRREDTVLTMADNDEDEAEAQWDMWKSELVDEGFTKVELEGHKQWIKAKLLELIESGVLHEQPPPERGGSSKASSHAVPSASQPSTPDNASASQSQPNIYTKRSDLSASPKKQSSFQATVEDVDDKETGIEGNEKTIETEARSGSMNCVAQDANHEVEDEVDDASKYSEASNGTDDTFLPTDSISNVGISTTAHSPDIRITQTVSSTARPDQPIDGGLDEGGKSKVNGEPQSTKITIEPKPRVLTKDKGISKGMGDSRESLFDYEVRTADPKSPRHARVKQEPIVPKSHESLGEEPIRHRPRRKPARPRSFEDLHEESLTVLQRGPTNYGMRSGSQHNPQAPQENKGTSRSRDYEDSVPSPAFPYYSVPWEKPNPGYNSNYHANPPRPDEPSNGDGYGYDQRGYYPKPRQYPPPSPGYVPPQSNPVDNNGSRPLRFSTGGDGGNGFQFSNAESVFAEFLRQPGPDIDDIFANLKSAGRSRQAREPSPSVDATAVERPLALTLEELFTGTHKKMKVVGKIHDEYGKTITKDRILEMDIKPGLKKGSKIKFRGVGDVDDVRRQDLHFIVEEKPHPLFTRDGNDLHHTVELTLMESLCGWNRVVTTIDGKKISIEKAGPTQPGSSDTYPELGMPSKRPGMRGNFIVKYTVKYPRTLSDSQKAKLRVILDSFRLPDS